MSSATTTVSYQPHTLVINDFPRGDTFMRDRIEVKENGVAVDLTGYTAAMRIEQKDGTLVANLTSAPSGGIVLGVGYIEIRTQTTSWPANCTLYADLQLTTPGGNIETWLRFIINVRKSITPPT
jgi:hypothetical protein